MECRGSQRGLVSGACSLGVIVAKAHPPAGYFGGKLDEVGMMRCSFTGSNRGAHGYVFHVRR